MNKKGFTLIELLAVIVILAVLMVIAVPKILDVIENSRKSAAKSSAELYIDAIEKNNVLSEMNDDYLKIDDGTINIAKINIKLKGDGPSSGEITINKNKVKEAKLCMNNYSIYYDGNKTEINGDFCNGDFELDKSELCDYKVGQEWNFDYVENMELNGHEQVFNVPCEATYKLETWGAQGGSYNETYHGGYGAYSTGYINLIKNEKLYINVGGSGACGYAGGSTTNITKGGYNGGGNSSCITSNTTESNTSCSGGGATHIATVSGLLSELEGYKGDYIESNGTYNSEKILIVSGGGSGSVYGNNNNSRWAANGGSGGGIEGCIYELASIDTSSTRYSASATPSTQKNIGTVHYDDKTYTTGNFGQGGSEFGSGSGSGWYGGSSYTYATGGSSFIGSSRLTLYQDQIKSMYCYNCTESSETETYTVSTTNVSETAIGQYAKQGNGYAKITLISFE